MADFYCLRTGPSLGAQALVIISCGLSLGYIKSFLLLCFGSYRAGEPELSNLKEKGVSHYP